MKSNYILFTLCALTLTIQLHGQTPDTIIVELASKSKLVLTVADREDLTQLRQYDYDALFDDMLTKLEAKDSAIHITVGNPEPALVVASGSTTTPVTTTTSRQHEDDKPAPIRYCNRPFQTFNFDFGINNYLEDGQFPDDNGSPYTVRPWGSWNIAVNSVQHIYITKNVQIEAGLGVSWYNFKFEDEYTLLTEGPDGVTFSEDTRDLDFTKSKLAVTYINASIIPMFDVNNRQRGSRFWNSHHSAFRIGVGPYVGYRVESHTRQVYEVEEEVRDFKDRDNFYLNNLRYGARLQIGFREADFYASYDLNELFTAGKGPSLHPFSFGVIF